MSTFRDVIRSLGPLAAALALAAACSEQLPVPSPVPTPNPAPNQAGRLVQRIGTPIDWTWLGATPEGDCMADELNRSLPGSIWPEFRVAITREGSSIRLFFNPDLEDDVGFLPGNYQGHVMEDGNILAPYAPLGDAPFVNPYGTGPNAPCYTTFILVDGLLTGRVEADGETISGTVVDNFRDVPTGKFFTVRSSFRTRK